MIEVLPARDALFQVGMWQVHWYGGLYVLAFGLAWLLAMRLQQFRGLSLSRDQWTSIVVAVAAGAVIGGRLGYALLYEPAFFATHPLKLFALPAGGMSAHGGMLGALVALWFFARRTNTQLLALLDLAAPLGALGIALGRFGNYVNGELYVGAGALSVALAHAVIAAGCVALLRRRPPAGIVFAQFLFLYSFQRLGFAHLRTDPWLEPAGLTLGQWYTLPLIGIAVVLTFRIVFYTASHDASR